MENSIQLETKKIASYIYLFRGEKVIMDFTLAQLYEVEVRMLKRAVRRNIQRFPEDFMFELTKEEYISLRSHFGILKWRFFKGHFFSSTAKTPRRKVQIINIQFLASLRLCGNILTFEIASSDIYWVCYPYLIPDGFTMSSFNYLTPV